MLRPTLRTNTDVLSESLSELEAGMKTRLEEIQADMKTLLQEKSKSQTKMPSSQLPPTVTAETVALSNLSYEKLDSRLFSAGIGRSRFENADPDLGGLGIPYCFNNVVEKDVQPLFIEHLQAQVSFFLSLSVSYCVYVDHPARPFVERPL